MRLRPFLLGLLFIAGCAGDDESDAPACTGSLCPGAPGSPQFGGVVSVSPDATGARLRVTWAPAVDDVTPAEEITYRIYVSTYAGRATRKAAVATVAGTSAYVAVAPTGVNQFVVVRAVDKDGREDGNTVEKSVLASGDTTPPTFSGVKTVTTTPGARVTLAWDPATDDKTAPEGMRYVVYRVDDRASTILATTDAATTITVPGGAAGEKRRYQVRALDAADNLDQSSRILEGTAGADTAAPQFAGCGAVTALGSRVVQVRWDAAQDDGTASAELVYEVFVTKAGASADYAAPTATVKGGTEAIVRDLEPGQRYDLVCRVRDSAGNRDGNTKAASVTTLANATPPTFSGATGTVDPIARKVSFGWTAATDDATPTASIVYAIYQAADGKPFDFTQPVALTGGGATSFELTGLPSRASLRWVVRARDRELNEDANSAETTGTTNTSFALDVQPFFGRNCAVVGCHVPVMVGQGIPFSLAPADAYASIVDVDASQRPESVTYKRVAPGNSTDSYLYRKLTGTGIIGLSMPAPGTGTVLSDRELDIVKTWIDQGAAKN